MLWINKFVRIVLITKERRIYSIPCHNRSYKSELEVNCKVVSSTSRNYYSSLSNFLSFCLSCTLFTFDDLDEILFCLLRYVNLYPNKGNRLKNKTHPTARHFKQPNCLLQLFNTFWNSSSLEIVRLCFTLRLLMFLTFQVWCRDAELIQSIHKFVYFNKIPIEKKLDKSSRKNNKSMQRAALWNAIMEFILIRLQLFLSEYEKWLLQWTSIMR